MYCSMCVYVVTSDDEYGCAAEGGSQPFLGASPADFQSPETKQFQLSN